MTLARTLCFAAAIVLSLAAPGAELDRVLLPVVIDGEVAGAQGSRWTTTVAITNHHPEEVEIVGYDWVPEGGCVIATCPPQPLTRSGLTFFPSVSVPLASAPAALLLVDRNAVDDVEIQLRVQDVSRQSETWGTELPVVHESQFRADAVHLTDIPVTTGFRSTLRVYDLVNGEAGSVTVKVYAVDRELRTPVSFASPEPEPDPLLLELNVPLWPQQHGSDARFAFRYAQLADLHLQLRLAGVDRVRIEITPATPAQPLWAFMSITNDATQHVTTITP